MSGRSGRGRAKIVGKIIHKPANLKISGLAPRVGKSGASIRLYWQRVDGCECICEEWNDPIVIQKRYLIPGALEPSTDYFNSSGFIITDSNASPVVSTDPLQWTPANAAVSNYKATGNQTDRIYYAIVLSRDVNPVQGNIVPTNDLTLGYRIFRDNNLNTVYPGGAAGTPGGQFQYVGPPQSGGAEETVFKVISYGNVGAMDFGINERYVIPKEDYTIVSDPSTISWVQGPYEGQKLETDRSGSFFGNVESGWRIDLSGVELDNFPGVRRWCGPGQSHWGSVNDPARRTLTNKSIHNPNHMSADNVFIVHNPIHFGGYTLLFNISQAIIESTDINGQATGYNPTVGVHAFCWGYTVGNILTALYNPNPGTDYSAEVPGESAVSKDGKGHGPLEIWHSSTAQTAWGIMNGGVTNQTATSKENDPWMALHWFVYNNGISTYYNSKGTYKLQTSNNINKRCGKYDDDATFVPSGGVASFKLESIGPNNSPPNLEWWYKQNV